jgi:hypothetical protein
MNKYALRKNFTSLFFDGTHHIKGKLAFKTIKTNWLNTDSPVIILLSVKSAFHEEVTGDLKTHALISTIKESVNGKVTILLSDGAHLHVNSLENRGDLKKTLENSTQLAKNLAKRYHHYFEKCDVAYWHSYITLDASFPHFMCKLKNLYDSDVEFKKLIEEDAERLSQPFSFKSDYVEHVKLDLLDQCAAIFILAKKGYRFQFYPGKTYPSVDYINQKLLKEKIEWVDVFLTIEKKVKA